MSLGVSSYKLLGSWGELSINLAGKL